MAALAALFHDLIITAGIYSLIGFEVTPATVIAILTILGYSLYDTVVVFDKITENVHELRNRVHVHRDRQPLDEPGADAVDQHVADVAAADRQPALRRLLPARSHDAA